jgi:nucleotide-binding universal stress UspA family protein
MMSEHRLYPNRKVEDIFLPSDFSEGSETAFFHALKLALASKSMLTVLHVDPEASADWQDFPGVRETLERWKIIPPGSPRNAVGKLGIDIRKIVARGDDPVKACTAYLQIHNADLIVLAVQQREGIMRWLGKSVGEPIARDAKQMTLFVPRGIQGFVSREDGSVTLKNILIPVAVEPDAQPAVEAVIRLIESLDLPPGTVTLLRVSPPEEMLPVQLPSNSSWTWNELVLKGEPAQVILQTAEKLNADLIVMTTDGPDGFLDGLRGTTSERVLSKANCPVGSLPVDSLLG